MSKYELEDALETETNVVEGKFDKDLEEFLTHRSKLVRKAAVARIKLLQEDGKMERII